MNEDMDKTRWELFLQTLAQLQEQYKTFSADEARAREEHRRTIESMLREHSDRVTTAILATSQELVEVRGLHAHRLTTLERNQAILSIVVCILALTQIAILVLVAWRAM